MSLNSINIGWHFTPPETNQVAEVRRDMASNNRKQPLVSTTKKFSGPTNLKTVSVSYTWVIEKFSVFCQGEPDELLISENFGSPEDQNLKWNLELLPSGRMVNKRIFKKYMEIYLKLVTNDECNVRATYNFSILNSEGKKTKESSETEVRKIVKGKSMLYGFKKFVERDHVLDNSARLLENDTLKIFCEITYHISGIISASGSTEKPSSSTFANNKQDLSVSNAVTLLISAYSQQGGQEQMRHIIDFVSNRLKEIVDNGSFNKLILSHPRLVILIMEKRLSTS